MDEILGEEGKGKGAKRQRIFMKGWLRDGGALGKAKGSRYLGKVP